MRKIRVLAFVAILTIAFSSCSIRGSNTSSSSTISSGTDTSSTSEPIAPSSSEEPSSSSESHPTVPPSVSSDEYFTESYRISPVVSLDGETAPVYAISSEPNDGTMIDAKIVDELIYGEVYTDPEDVALYYQAFGEAPINYFENKTEAANFGKDGRKISTYRYGDYDLQKPGSYAQNLGEFNNKDRGVYLELDIALNSSYRPNGGRGAGRVVIVVDGIEDYGADPVCYYTENHYSTFKEFGNFQGAFGKEFKGANSTTGYPVHLPLFTVGL